MRHGVGGGEAGLKDSLLRALVKWGGYSITLSPCCLAPQLSATSQLQLHLIHPHCNSLTSIYFALDQQASAHAAGCMGTAQGAAHSPGWHREAGCPRECDILSSHRRASFPGITCWLSEDERVGMRVGAWPPSPSFPEGFCMGNTHSKRGGGDDSHCGSGQGSS